MHYDLISKKRRQFEEYFGKKRDIEYFFSPGRVNLIGEHLDYNGGSVLPASISLGIYAIVSRRNDNIIRLRSSNFSDEVIFGLNDDLKYDHQVSWGNFPRGIVKFFQENGYSSQGGVDAYFYSNLPEGAGLSSSACIEILSAYIFYNNLIKNENDRIHMAELCKMVENKFIGVQCGIMDQFAIAMGKSEHAILLNTVDLSYQYVPLKMGDYTFIIINTNKQRKLTDSKYNERSKECSEALRLIHSENNIDHLARTSMEELKKISNSTLYKRARHVISEQQRVMDTVEALKSNRIKEFGELMNSSHNSLKSDYEVTGKELDSLVTASLMVEGCIGARMTGAGFGGCAIALVHNEALDDFKQFVGKKYNKDTNLIADFYLSKIDDGVKSIYE